ncbi:DNA-binding transcriptional LysR family regulator [Xanthomonas campestris]|uniref:LysR family transcriptional regulator n=1 Tax=Xanthomonas sp. CFBP 8151 TaxID=3035310 RepID=UPI00141BB8BA|nr:LysR family transcriptional regulator [Xanthomonas sp. CFBP 8151]NIJ77750.1 DNA-binding transcriptional LysR family regulator [Xanthomonas sp. CFBP 8151]
MPKPTFNDLAAFTSVAVHRSFRRAATELGLAPSSLSHLISALERNLGVRLLHRTTRSVSLTEAGERLYAKLVPALQDVEQALSELDAFRSGPAGTVRINAPEVVVRLLLQQVVPEVLARYPALSVDLVSEGRLVDIVAAGFDAGIRLSESVPQDMIAVPFGGQTRFIAVAAPAYLQRAGSPDTPDDLHRHACIRHRMPSGRLYRWEFERRGQELAIDVPGRLTLDQILMMGEAAEAGLGIAYVPEHAVMAALARGTLVRVLEQWCPAIPGLVLYYPGHRQIPPGLRAFIDTLKQVLP